MCLYYKEKERKKERNEKKGYHTISADAAKTLVSQTPIAIQLCLLTRRKKEKKPHNDKEKETKKEYEERKKERKKEIQFQLM